jgi:outer membrane protein assembly factor BamB
MGATGILDCLDLKTGALLWSKNVLEENQSENIRWGKSASPLLVDDMLVVSLGKGGPTLAAYARADGKLLWTGGDDDAAYASPMLGTLVGKRQILSTNDRSITGHDLENGNVLWSGKWTKNMPKVAVPMALPDDHVLAPVGYAERGKLLKIAADDDGTMSATEVWSGIKMKVKFSNVCVKGEYAYGLDETYLSCIEWRTGKRIWKDGKYGYGQNILAGDYLLIQAEDGFVALVDASPDGYRERGRLEALSSMTWNTPTLAGKYLLVRNDIEAVCYELPVK